MEILIVSIILATLLFMGFVAYEADRLQGEFYEFQKHDIVDIPYVTIEIQGHSLNMIVDTGCGSSILHKPAAESLGIQYTESNKRTTLSALTHETIDMKNVFVDYELNGEKVRDEFILYDADAFGNFDVMYGITIHGLLGTDFFNAHKCAVDFKTHKLKIRK